LVLPLEIHIFEYGSTHYLFDCRNYSILTLGSQAAAVAARASELTLEELLGECKDEIPADTVRACYCKLLQLIESGTVSSAPLQPAKRPLFHRIVLMLAGGCNMACRYCFERSVPVYQDLNLMTQECAQRALAWFWRHHEGNKAHVQFYGGEPLLNWPVFTFAVEQMEKWAEASNIELTLYLITNGTLLNRERIAYLAAHQIKAQVSADGNAETHDRFRVLKSGAPSLERICPNIRELADQGVDFNVRAVMTRWNLDPESVIEGLRSLGAEKVSFEIVATDSPDARLTLGDWAGFEARYAEYLRHPYQSWGELPREMQTIIESICECKRLTFGCGAGVSEITIAPDGGIYECQRLFRPPYAHVNDDKSPAEMKSDFLTMVDDRPICRDCWARYLCGGGCVHQAHTEGCGDRPFVQFCAMKRRLAEASIAKIHQIRSLNGAEEGRQCIAAT
jgi:uncharacterized protein